VVLVLVYDDDGGGGSLLTTMWRATRCCFRACESDGTEALLCSPLICPFFFDCIIVRGSNDSNLFAVVE